MTELTKNQLNNYSRQILDDYDSKTPGTIFKEKVRISVEDAWYIQSTVAGLREERGEKVIGYKIGCISKETQLKMGFTKPAWGRLWKHEVYSDGIILEKSNYSNTAMEAEFGMIVKRDLIPA